MKWEYGIEQFYLDAPHFVYPHEDVLANMVPKLNNLGKDGWEVYHLDFMQEPMFPFQKYVIVYSKRKID